MNSDILAMKAVQFQNFDPRSLLARSGNLEILSMALHFNFIFWFFLGFFSFDVLNVVKLTTLEK